MKTKTRDKRKIVSDALKYCRTCLRDVHEATDMIDEALEELTHLIKFEIVKTEAGNDRPLCCPMCGAHASIELGRKHTRPTQSYHDEDTTYQSASVTCNGCGWLSLQAYVSQTVVMTMLWPNG